MANIVELKTAAREHVCYARLPEGEQPELIAWSSLGPHYRYEGMLEGMRVYREVMCRTLAQGEIITETPISSMRLPSIEFEDEDLPTKPDYEVEEQALKKGSK